MFANQLPALWRHGPVTIADNTRDVTMAAIAGRILAHAPPRHPELTRRGQAHIALARGGRFAEVPDQQLPC